MENLYPDPDVQHTGEQSGSLISFGDTGEVR